MQKISIDIETFSDVDLRKCGVYKYVESPNFAVLLFGYSIDEGEVKVVDLASGETIPDDILAALEDENVIKWAYNANFERVCLSRFLGFPTGKYLSPVGWKCSKIWAAYLGLPQTLKAVGAALDLENQKLDEGKALIRLFSVPNKNGERTMPKDNPEKWLLFKKYNKRDAEVEMAIQSRLSKFPVPKFVWEEYHLDQTINDRGIALDMELVENAIRFDERSKAELSTKLRELTNLENPNSVMQMKKWLAKNGLEVDSLGKKEVAEMLKTAPTQLAPDVPVAEVLELRQQLSKSSVKKYQAMQNAVCSDGRARGMFQFYGANRTGRFSGKLVQLQNLPQNHISDLEQARELVKSGDFETAKLLYDNIPQVLSELIRTAFVPRDGMKFVVSDFSAIEARVIAWLAGENWRTEVFKNGGDIYCASASQMFKVPVEKHGINGHLRQKGKIAELALGYGGSVGALKAMGATEMGLQEDELKPLVDSWRAANPHIVQLWWDVDKAVKQAVKEHSRTETHGIKFIYQSGVLFVELPSKRRLAYVKPRIVENIFGSESVTYMGIGMNKKWERLESYGPKFVENIVQAISRDILCYAMRTLSYCNIVGHVHDELIIECSLSPLVGSVLAADFVATAPTSCRRRDVSLNAICEQMSRTPEWAHYASQNAEGLLLRADGYECEFYKKD